MQVYSWINFYGKARPFALPSLSGPHSEPQTVVQEVQRKVQEVLPQVAADDLDVPTFLRRQAQKA